MSSTKRTVSIVAMDDHLGIGKDGGIPWRFKSDMDHFRQTTTETVDPSKQNAVVMGRVTYESIPKKFRPLPRRLNVVLSSSKEYLEQLELTSQNVKGFQTMEETREYLNHCDTVETVYLCGGQQVYRDALDIGWCDEILCTNVPGVYHCDRFFPQIAASTKSIFLKNLSSENDSEPWLNIVKYVLK